MLYENADLLSLVYRLVIFVINFYFHYCHPTTSTITKTAVIYSTAPTITIATVLLSASNGINKISDSCDFDSNHHISQTSVNITTILLYSHFCCLNIEYFAWNIIWNIEFKFCLKISNNFKPHANGVLVRFPKLKYHYPISINFGIGATFSRPPFTYFLIYYANSCSSTAGIHEICIGSPSFNELT